MLARGPGQPYKEFRVAMLSKPPYPTLNQFILSLQSHEQMFMSQQDDEEPKQALFIYLKPFLVNEEEAEIVEEEVAFKVEEEHFFG